jgi:hypothetical protein
MPDNEFDLRALILDEIETSAVADPIVIAEHVAKQVPTKYLREALALALRETVRTTISGERVKVQHQAERAAAGKSTKWADAGEMYKELLGQRVEVGGEDREWKFLGDCTRDDLLNAVGFRKKQAQSLIVSARRYEAIAQLLDKHGMARVSELPMPDLAAVYA